METVEQRLDRLEREVENLKAASHDGPSWQEDLDEQIMQDVFATLLRYLELSVPTFSARHFREFAKLILADTLKAMDRNVMVEMVEVRTAILIDRMFPPSIYEDGDAVSPEPSPPRGFWPGPPSRK